MAINVLDTMIINRISAGEVVESPFSIVKELLDNAIDAGATKIYVEIVDGGTTSITVKDNGKGIDQEDMVKAFLPHATSKIKQIEDLEAIETLGFRGEALASISNVSHTKLTTKTKNVAHAYSLEVDGGAFGEINPSSGDNGTKIEVNDLFYNTPARRKFMKKPKQEESQITNIMARYILANPTISFTYVADGRTIYKTAGNTLLDAIYCVYGAETAQSLLKVEKSIGNISLSGCVSKIGFSKPNTTYQTLMINSRYVVDEIVSKAVYMAFEEYLMTRQFPFYVLNLTMPSIDVDVNVHPSKLNVKFANPSKIYDLVYSATRSAIYQAINPTPTFARQEEASISEENAITQLIAPNLNSLTEIEIAPNELSKPNGFVSLKQTTFSPITMFDLNKETTTPTKPMQTEQDFVWNKTKENQAEEHLVDVENFAKFKVVGQLFNEFLVLEKDSNMLLLDFHAGHERLNYDKFTAQVKSRKVVVQDLLIPYTHEMTEQEVDFILNLKQELFDLGFEVDAFGDRKIVINAVPMQLKDINLKNFVDDLLHDMKNLKPKMNNEVHNYLAQKACKSSVKAGMTLSELEINDLLKNLDMKNPVLLCPHGRPIVTVVAKSQIEKWFKRIV